MSDDPFTTSTTDQLKRSEFVLFTLSRARVKTSNKDHMPYMRVSETGETK